jgi:hypothetical protein
VAIGIGLEVAQLVLFLLQDKMPAGARVVADTCGKVTWSFCVCFGLSIGMAAGRARPQVMALLGLLSAPAGFAIARSVHKSVGSALQVAPGAAEALSPFLLAGIKAVEYGIFGVIVARLSSRPVISLKGHVLAGLGIGFVVGILVMVLLKRALPNLGTLDLVGRTIPEFLFPAGCAAVVYVTERASRLARGVV